MAPPYHTTPCADTACNETTDAANRGREWLSSHTLYCVPACCCHESTQRLALGLCVPLLQKAASGRCGSCVCVILLALTATITCSTSEDAQKSTATKLIYLPEHFEHNSTVSCKNGRRLKFSSSVTENCRANHSNDPRLKPIDPTFVKWFIRVSSSHCLHIFWKTQASLSCCGTVMPNGVSVTK